MGLNFAVIGVGGFVAPRHLKAIQDTGNRLVAAVDPNDSVGILDRYSLDVRYFREIERFDRHLDKLRRGPEENRVNWVSVCSPNYLHDAHIRMAMRNGADVICEKPIVISPWNLDALEALEAETGRKVLTVLQLRIHPSLVALKERLRQSGGGRKQVQLTYVTGRGLWYDVSWKGSSKHSGGVAMNIGVHLFDLLLWLFGPVVRAGVHLREERRCAGFLELANADVTWLLSVDTDDLPSGWQQGKPTTFRSIRIDGDEIEFSEGFGDLHTRVYEGILRGEGYGIGEARPSIELVHRIRNDRLSDSGEMVHPALSARITA